MTAAWPSIRLPSHRFISTMTDLAGGLGCFLHDDATLAVRITFRYSRKLASAGCRETFRRNIYRDGSRALLPLWENQLSPGATGSLPSHPLPFNISRFGPPRSSTNSAHGSLPLVHTCSLTLQLRLGFTYFGYLATEYGSPTHYAFVTPSAPFTACTHTACVLHRRGAFLTVGSPSVSSEYLAWRRSHIQTDTCSTWSSSQHAFLQRAVTSSRAFLRCFTTHYRFGSGPPRPSPPGNLGRFFLGHLRSGSPGSPDTHGSANDSDESFKLHSESPVLAYS